MAGLLNGMIKTLEATQEAPRELDLTLYPAGVSGLIEGNLASFDTTPEDDSWRNQKYTHVSSLVNGICPRAQVIAKRFGVSLEPSLITGMKMIWAMGRSVEAHVRTALMSQLPDQFYGRWQCPCHKTIFEGTRTEALTIAPRCDCCGKRPLDYRELALFDEELEISGSLDMVLKLTKNKYHVIECKSISAKGWESVMSEGAKMDHKLQGGYYVRMLRMRQQTEDVTGSVLYGLKDFKWGTPPYKAFDIPMRDAGLLAGFRMMEKVARDMKAARALGDDIKTLPPRIGACPNAQSQTAKKCRACSTCFAMN